MALKKPTPAFENETSGVATAEAAQTPTEAAVNAVMGDTAAAPAAPAPAEVAQAKVAGTVAIATAVSSSLSTQDAAKQAKAFAAEVASMRGLDDFKFGNFSVFKGGNGEIAGKVDGADVSMGRWAKVRLMSWNDHYEVSPGESGASTKDFVAYSKDGKTIDSVIGSEMQDWVGRPVEDYVAYLKDEKDGEGFKNTKNRRFIDTACAILGTDSGDGPIGKVVQISLSPTSLSAFDRYQSELATNARCVAMGLPGFTLRDDPFVFFFVREVANKGTDRWTKLSIHAVLPAKL